MRHEDDQEKQSQIKFKNFTKAIFNYIIFIWSPTKTEIPSNVNVHISYTKS